MSKPNYHVEIVKFDEIDIRGIYTNKVYEATWIEGDNKVRLQTRDENGNSVKSVVIGDNMNLQNNFDSSKLGFDYDFNSAKTHEYDTLGQSHHRRRRSLWQNDKDDTDDYEVNDDKTFRVYNQYTGSIDEYTSSYRVSVDKEDPILMNLPRNRTIFIDCSQPEDMNECIEAQFTVHNFRPGSEPITISMNFTIDLRKFGKNKFHFPYSLCFPGIKLPFVIQIVNCFSSFSFHPSTSTTSILHEQEKFLMTTRTFLCTRQMQSFNVPMMRA